MPVTAFDTLKYAKQLKQAGIPAEQAEAQAAALADAMQTGLQDLATRNDIDQLRQATKTEIAQLKNDIDQLRQEFKNETALIRQAMKAIEARHDGQMMLLKWMLGATFAGVIGIFIRLFFFRVV